MTKVLIVEDDIELSHKIRQWLEFEKYIVELTHRGKDAAQLLKTYHYDVIVLDWQLPDATGVDILKEFRAGGGQTPTLMLTGKDTIRDKETGLDAGADDYVTKPFHLKELSARLRALLRRAPALTPETLILGDLELHVGTFQLTKKGQPLQLLPKEFAMLEYLMRHPGQVFSAKALLDAVWESDTNAAEDTIRTYLKTLRRKITAEGEECPIRTVHGVGYKIEF